MTDKPTETEHMVRATAVKTVKIGPEGWEEALPLLLAVYEDGTPTGRAEALKELRRMAELADRYVDLSK